MPEKQGKPILIADDGAADVQGKKRSKSVSLYVSRLAEKLGSPTDQMTATQRHPAQAILKRGDKRNGYELVALGTHGRTGIKRIVLGSVAETVIRESKTPVLTIGPKAQNAVSEFLRSPKTTILVPTSLTEESAAAERYALKLAKRLRAELIYFHDVHESLHAVLKTAYTVPNLSPDVARMREKHQAQLERQLLKKVERAQQRGVQASYVLDQKDTSAAKGALECAKRYRASIIVMGTRGHSLIGGLFLGHVSREVILNASLPVITVSSAGRGQ